MLECAVTRPESRAEVGRCPARPHRRVAWFGSACSSWTRIPVSCARSGVRLSVQDQPLQVLKLLLERPGELVTREELRQQLWPSDTFVGFEHGLNAAVGRLRETLGDSADAPRFIETLPRRGYRFVGTIADDGRGVAQSNGGSPPELAGRPAAAAPNAGPGKNTTLRR